MNSRSRRRMRKGTRLRAREWRKRKRGFFGGKRGTLRLTDVCRGRLSAYIDARTSEIYKLYWNSDFSFQSKRGEREREIFSSLVLYTIVKGFSRAHTIVSRVCERTPVLRALCEEKRASSGGRRAEKSLVRGQKERERGREKKCCTRVI